MDDERTKVRRRGGGRYLLQNALVLNHLIHHGPLTPAMAEELYGVWRLAARIYDLRRMGHDIDKDMVEIGDYENHRFAAYYLVRLSDDPVH